METAEDSVMRAELTAKEGVEGSWGDRLSFLRAHSLIPDVYRKDVAAARTHMRELAKSTTNGEI